MDEKHIEKQIDPQDDVVSPDTSLETETAELAEEESRESKMRYL